MHHFHLEKATSLPDESAQALKATWFDTPLGSMMAIADEDGLYFLDFIDRSRIERGMRRLKQKLHRPIIKGQTPILSLIEEEIIAYFKGKLEKFTTPLIPLGSPFQKRVWEILQGIPYGGTCSYAEVAQKVGIPTAFRAVANANGANPIAIVVPCHRVIRSSGDLGGYGGGIPRKKWLIGHESDARCQRSGVRCQ